MPQYIYEHPETGEIKEIVQKMNDVHEYEEDGIKWRRIFTKPKMSIDTKIDARSEEDFVRKTSGKNLSVGDLWDKSHELSEKRGGENDPIRQKAYDKYEKRTGKKHPKKKVKVETEQFEAEL